MIHAIKALGFAQMRVVEADVRGTPEAIAEARARLREAQRRAQIELYGACAVCETPYVSEGAKCRVCHPTVVYDEPNWIDRQVLGADDYEGGLY